MEIDMLFIRRKFYNYSRHNINFIEDRKDKEDYWNNFNNRYFLGLQWCIIREC